MSKDFVEIVRVRAMFCLKLSMKLFVPRVLEVKNSSGFLEKQFCSSGAVIKEPIEHRHIKRRHDRYLLSGHYLCSVRRRFSRSAIKTRHIFANRIRLTVVQPPIHIRYWITAQLMATNRTTRLNTE